MHGRETVCVLCPTHRNPLKVSCHYNNSVWAGAGMQHGHAVNNKAHKNMMMESFREDVSLNHRQLRSEEEYTVLNTSICHCYWSWMGESDHVTAEEKRKNINCTSESESEEVQTSFVRI